MQIRAEGFVKFVNLVVALALTVLFAGAETSVAQQQKVSLPKPAAVAQSDKTTAADNSATANEPIIGNGTAKTIPVFTGPHAIHNSLITQTGNGIQVAGTVNAVAFTGNGSALTNVPAVQLGGLPPSAFAQTGAANTFTADQAINGNLNLTGYINGAFSLQGNVTDANGQQGANVLGGFLGTAASGGNSIAPGVIGATIGGGGGLYDPSLAPQPRALNRQQPAIRLTVPKRSRDVFSQSDLQSTQSEAAPRNQEESTVPPLGLTLGLNQIELGGDWATIAGGLDNTAAGYAATVGGGYVNSASALEATVGGGAANGATDQYTTVGGGNQNNATASWGTVSGGTENTASDVGSTVGGGFLNTASGNDDGFGAATVAGGASNQATADRATVGGGASNNASAEFSTVSGGASNTASGGYSTIPGGVKNVAAGLTSFAAGCHATANYPGSFVWSSGTDGSCDFIQDTNSGQFVAMAYGGFYFYTSGFGPTGSGATLPSGSGSWSSLSDRNVKANFLAIDPGSLLKKLAAMPISTWNYKTQAESIRHLGPTAQDFHEAFGLGEDDKHISTVDAQGVALAGIQALYQTVVQLKQSLADKDHEIDDLRTRLANLEQSSVGK